MATRRLYVVRHGAADAFGALTDVGQRQTELLAERLARLPVAAVWHSPLPRAVRSAQLIGEHLRGVPVREAAELVDHVPHVPEELPAAWAGIFDGYDPAEAAAGERLADALTNRFARPAESETHEVLVTHAYQVCDVIGRVGATGNVTGAHLHLEVHSGGADNGIDPMAWLRSKGLNP